jgi:hypothetical protein
VPSQTAHAQVTLQSFLWSPRVAERGTKADVAALIERCQTQLHAAPSVDLAALPCTSASDLAGILRRATSGEGGSIDASVKRVVIGKVCCWLTPSLSLGWHAVWRGACADLGLWPATEFREPGGSGPSHLQLRTASIATYNKPLE